MKKRVLAAFLSLAMAFALVACGGGGSSSQGGSASTGGNSETGGGADNSGEQVTIRFANYALLEAGYTEFWEGVKDGFETQNPNITIDWVTAPYDEITNQVINMAGGGEIVDLLFGEIGWVSTLADAGLSVPIDRVMDASFINDVYPNVLEGFMVDGDVYGVPLYVSSYILYYNKDIFEAAGLDPDAPPTTYTEMLAMAEQIDGMTTEDGNKIYAFGQTTASVPVSGSAITGMVYNFGGDVLDSDGGLVTGNAGFKEAVEMLQLLDSKGYNPENAKLKDLRNLFALGQLAMYYDQSWGFNGVQSINEDAYNFTASAMPLSGGSGNAESILQSHCFMLMDNGPAQTEAVRLLVEYIISEEVLGDYMRNITPAFPALQSMSNMELSPVLEGARESVSTAKAVALIPQLTELNLELCTLAQAVTVSGEDVDSAIESFYKTAATLTP